jgi:TonB family protein
MPPLPARILIVCVLSSACAVWLRAQDPVAPPPNAPALKLDYPDSTAGLENLVKDIIKAQKENAGDRADALLQTLVLPQPRAWYDMAFGTSVAEESKSLYEKSGASIPNSMAQFLLHAVGNGMNDVAVVRFDKSCDDNSGEDVFGILEARRQPIPLYELRLIKAPTFVRLFAFAFVDGGFRFILPPKLHGNVFGPPKANPAPAANSADSGATAPVEKRLTIAGKVQAARLITKVAPQYPQTARAEHLQGTVKMHALIDKDGSLFQLYVVKGYCSLAQASIDAVKKWRYSPTLLEGQPVQVDTEIDVIFTLHP